MPANLSDVEMSAHEEILDPEQCSRVPIVLATMLRLGSSNGVQTHVSEVRAYLNSVGAPSVIVNPFSWGKRLSIPVFGCRFLLSKSAGIAWYLHWHHAFLRHALRRHLSHVQEAVIYAQDPFSALAALEARQNSRQRIVMVVHFHGSQADEWVWRGQIQRDGKVFSLIRDVERKVIPQLDGIVFVSQSARQALSDWLGSPIGVPAMTIPNFISFNPRTRTSVPTADLVTVGSLDAPKNHEFLFEVLARANRAGRRYSLDIIGHGPRENHLVRYAKSLGLDGQVRFLGYRPNARVLLPNYKVYVHAATVEAMGIALIEAMAAGLPILAGPVGGIPELFDHSFQSWAWPLEDAEGAAALLIDLLEDPRALIRAQAAGRNRFARCFDAAVVGPELYEFLRSASSARL